MGFASSLPSIQSRSSAVTSSGEDIRHYYIKHCSKARIFASRLACRCTRACRLKHVRSRRNRYRLAWTPENVLAKAHCRGMKPRSASSSSDNVREQNGGIHARETIYCWSVQCRLVWNHSYCPAARTTASRPNREAVQGIEGSAGSRHKCHDTRQAGSYGRI